LGSDDIVVGEMHFMNKYELKNAEQLTYKTLFSFPNLSSQIRNLTPLTLLTLFFQCVLIMFIFI